MTKLRYHRTYLVAASLIGMSLGASAPMAAQSIWLDRSQPIDQRQPMIFGMEFFKPGLHGDDQTTFATSSVFLSAWIPVTQHIRVVGEVPFAYYGVSTGAFSASDQTIGNPYLGMELRSPGGSVSGEFGLRLPLVSSESEAAFVGSFADLDRWEAFYEDLVPVTGMVNYHYRAPSGVVARLRGGPSFWFFPNGGETEVLFSYSAQVGYEARTVGLLGGLTGRTLATTDGDLGERSFHHFGTSAHFGAGPVRPGVHFRVPLDSEVNDVVDWVFGVNVSVRVRPYRTR